MIRISSKVNTYFYPIHAVLVRHRPFDYFEELLLGIADLGAQKLLARPWHKVAEENFCVPVAMPLLEKLVQIGKDRNLYTIEDGDVLVLSKEGRKSLENSYWPEAPQDLRLSLYYNPAHEEWLFLEGGAPYIQAKSKFQSTKPPLDELHAIVQAMQTKVNKQLVVQTLKVFEEVPWGNQSELEIVMDAVVSERGTLQLNMLSHPNVSLGKWTTEAANNILRNASNTWKKLYPAAPPATAQSTQFCELHTEAGKLLNPATTPPILKSLVFANAETYKNVLEIKVNDPGLVILFGAEKTEYSRKGTIIIHIASQCPIPGLLTLQKDDENCSRFLVELPFEESNPLYFGATPTKKYNRDLWAQLINSLMKQDLPEGMLILLAENLDSRFWSTLREHANKQVPTVFLENLRKEIIHRIAELRTERELGALILSQLKRLKSLSMQELETWLPFFGNDRNILLEFVHLVPLQNLSQLKKINNDLGVKNLLNHEHSELWFTPEICQELATSWKVGFTELEALPPIHAVQALKALAKNVSEMESNFPEWRNPATTKTDLLFKTPQSFDTLSNAMQKHKQIAGELRTKYPQIAKFLEPEIRDAHADFEPWEQFMKKYQRALPSQCTGNLAFLDTNVLLEQTKRIEESPAHMWFCVPSRVRHELEGLKRNPTTHKSAQEASNILQWLAENNRLLSAMPEMDLLLTDMKQNSIPDLEILGSLAPYLKSSTNLISFVTRDKNLRAFATQLGVKVFDEVFVKNKGKKK